MISDNIWMSQLFSHDLHFVHESSEVGVCLSSSASQSGVAAAYLLHGEQLLTVLCLVDLVDTAESSRAKELQNSIASDDRQRIFVLIGPFNVGLQYGSLTLLCMDGGMVAKQLGCSISRSKINRKKNSTYLKQG